MADAICAEAHRINRPSIALAQAIQFEGMLRQKDIIGEWVPIAEPGTSAVIHKGLKWLRGIRWEEIDENLVLRHVTSKRQKEVEIRLADAPMVVAELAKVERKGSGPVIVNESSGRPYSVTHFRQIWRTIATAAGVPKSVRNQDSRAGAITEATQAGADLESIKHAATHSDIAMTQRYARSSHEKSAKVMQMRAAHRTKTR
jgi:site-specific recombinase XerD